jgi:creatinine amidohydrolase
MKRDSVFLCALAVLLFVSLLFSQENSPIHNESRVKNYLPHMTWQEVEEALKTTDMALIPVGSVEQHGRHLPLGTDIFAAIEMAQLIARKTDIIVAPVSILGYADYHMGFPGTMTLTPETFEAVLFEGVQSLVRHGFKRFLIYTGHGGNNTSITKVIHRINHQTGATAISLNAIQLPPLEGVEEVQLDWHAGVSETSKMLYLTPSLVQIEKAEKPELTLPPAAQKAIFSMPSAKDVESFVQAITFLPEKTGKRATTRDMTSNGVITTGDPKTATAERGKKEVDLFVNAAVKYIEAWKKIGP